MWEGPKTYLHQPQVVWEPAGPPHQLWISGQHFAHKPQALQQYNIQAVVSVGSDPFKYPPEIKQLYLEAEDTDQQHMGSVWERAYDFIQKERETSDVLVHCVAGISRSASVVTYYLMRKHRWGLDHALTLLRQARPFVRPNPGFLRQLRQQEVELTARKPLPRF